jgi:tRNA(Ile)-lysidine synthase
MGSASGSRTSRPAPPAEAEPLTAGELERLFASLAGARLIALAVSGGADSLALLDAVDRWRRQDGQRPEVLVLTVDHRLRKGSAADARTVTAIARARGLKVQTLVRKGPPPDSDVEAAARIARYRLLVTACRKVGASHLLVAHHEDDVAETFLMRLKRGSGVFGLAAMRPLLSAGDVAIVRPFLGISRDRLAATARVAGFTPAVDPMNADPRFDRVRVRRLMPLLAGEGIAASSLASAARRFADFADAIERAADVMLAEAVETDDQAIAWLDASRLAAAGDDVAVRAFVRILIAVGGGTYPPRFERLTPLLGAVLAHREGRFKRTLAGCVVEWRDGRFAVYREFGREGTAPLPVRSGFAGVFDHRFVVSVGKGAPAELTLAPLGEAGRRRSVAAMPRGIPAGAAATLPALWRRGKLVAVPSLSGSNAPFPMAARSILAERLRRAPLFPDLGEEG